MIPEIVITLFKAMLTDPEMRAVLENLVLQMFSEIYFELEKDPVYKAAFVSLAGQLKDPTTTNEAKQDVLKKLQTLHSSR